MAVRVFLLDDHEIVRRGVRELLQAEGDIEVVGEAGTVGEAQVQQGDVGDLPTTSSASAAVPAAAARGHRRGGH